MRQIIYLLLMFKILSLELYSDGCTLPSGCEDKEYPYKLCNSNNLLYRCSKNPYNEWDGPTHLKPMKLDGCFQYDPLTYTLEYITKEWEGYGVFKYGSIIGLDPTGNPIYGYKSKDPIYKPDTDEEILVYNEGDPILEPYETHIIHYSEQIVTNLIFKDFWRSICFNFIKFDQSEYPDTKDNFNKALEKWKSLCNDCVLNNQDIQHCCVKISWTKDPSKFRAVNFDPSRVPAFASTKMKPGSAARCEFNCDELYVILNQTDEFTGNTKEYPGDYSRHFFITGSTSKNGWYSLTATFIHEMGHLFGLGDQYNNDGLNCDHSGSIMDGTDFENPNRDLSDDDKCMYMKMYCWEPPTVVEEDKEVFEGMRVFPNPINNNLINIQFGNPFGIKMTYEIVSPIGIIISTGNIQPNENPKTIILDNLASGVYSIILKNRGKQEIKKFIITR